MPSRTLQLSGGFLVGTWCFLEHLGCDYRLFGGCPKSCLLSPKKSDCETVAALFGLVPFSEDEMLQLCLRRWQRSEEVKRGVILVPSTPEPLLKSFNAE